MERQEILFLYWGRYGLSQFVLQFAEVLHSQPTPDLLSISRQNEDFWRFSRFNEALIPIDTFRSKMGALTQTWRIPIIRKRLIEVIRSRGIRTVIDVMPHAWSPFVVSAVKSAGAQYMAVVHDADVHPGDYRTRLAKHLLNASTRQADRIFTLSRDVAGRLEQKGLDSRKLHILFHPDLEYASTPFAPSPKPGESFRALFLGRIMPYKGLSLFLDAIEILRGADARVEARIYGEGRLDYLHPRIERLGVKLVNRWLSREDFVEALRWCHAVVVSHIEASQSGVVAAALGSGIPVVCTPVGGLREQINHLQTGIVVNTVDGLAIADGIKLLLNNPRLYSTICKNISRTAPERSMKEFYERLRHHALYAIPD